MTKLPKSLIDTGNPTNGTLCDADPGAKPKRFFAGETLGFDENPPSMPAFCWGFSTWDSAGDPGAGVLPVVPNLKRISPAERRRVGTIVFPADPPAQLNFAG